MKLQIEKENRKFTITAKLDKKATSNYDTNLYVSEDNKVVAGCTVKSTDTLAAIKLIAENTIQFYLSPSNLVLP